MDIGQVGHVGFYEPFAGSNKTKVRAKSWRDQVMESCGYGGKIDQKILDRLTELIEMGEKVTRTSYNPKGIAGTFVKEELAFQWGASS